MEYRRLGRSGLLVPVLSLGTGTFGGSGPLFQAWGQTNVKEATELVDICMEAGINLFDTADVYSNGASEEILGKAISGRRHQVLLSTKAAYNMEEGANPNQRGTSRFHLINALEASLKRLKTDYVDIFHLHGFDGFTPVEEIMGTLDSMVRSGKVRYLAASNYAAWQLMKAQAIADKYGWTPFVAHQAYYSLIGREYEWDLMGLGLDQNIGLIVWSPLGWGRLTGKVTRKTGTASSGRINDTMNQKIAPPVTDEELFKVTDVLEEIAQETGKTIPQIALNWLLQRPGVASIVIGARDKNQLKMNLGSVSWQLSDIQMMRLDKASSKPPYYPHWHNLINIGDRNPHFTSLKINVNHPEF